MEQPIQTGCQSATVIVVGGGVSGCACAATLAAAGVGVLVLSKSLDTVGLPAYGPDLVSPREGLHRVRAVLDSLPSPLREVWSGAAAVARPTRRRAGEDREGGYRGALAVSPEDATEDTSSPDDGYVNVDRRVLSIETKRALETVPGLQFRQGLVDDLRTAVGAAGGQEGRVAVETMFGEVFEADAVVLAVGLSMGGEVVLGEDRLPGGRYGEIPSDGLLRAMRRLGVDLDEVEVEVGARFPRGGDERHPDGSAGGVVRDGQLSDEELVGAAGHDLGSSPYALKGPTTEVAGGVGLDPRGRGIAGTGETALARVVPVTFWRLGGRSDAEIRGGSKDYPKAQGLRRHDDWPSDFPPAPHQGENLRLWRGVAVELATCEPCARATDAPSTEGPVDERSERVAGRHEEPGAGQAKKTSGACVTSGAIPAGGSDTVLCEVLEPVSGVQSSAVLHQALEGQASSCGPSDGRCDTVVCRLLPGVSPDGVATGEIYVDGEAGRKLGGGDPSTETGELCGVFARVMSRGVLAGSSQGEAAGAPGIASRLGYRVRGLVVRGVAEDGRVCVNGVAVGPVWVAGRAAGATDYVESLASGTRVAHSVIRYVRG